MSREAVRLPRPAAGPRGVHGGILAAVTVTQNPRGCCSRFSSTSWLLSAVIVTAPVAVTLVPSDWLRPGCWSHPARPWEMFPGSLAVDFQRHRGAPWPKAPVGAVAALVQRDLATGMHHRRHLPPADKGARLRGICPRRPAPHCARRSPVPAAARRRSGRGVPALAHRTSRLNWFAWRRPASHPYLRLPRLPLPPPSGGRPPAADRTRSPVTDRCPSAWRCPTASRASVVRWMPPVSRDGPVALPASLSVMSLPVAVRVDVPPSRPTPRFSGGRTAERSGLARLRSRAPRSARLRS